MALEGLSKLLQRGNELKIKIKILLISVLQEPLPLLPSSHCAPHHKVIELSVSHFPSPHLPEYEIRGVYMLLSDSHQDPNFGQMSPVVITSESKVC